MGTNVRNEDSNSSRWARGMSWPFDSFGGSSLKFQCDYKFLHDWKNYLHWFKRKFLFLRFVGPLFKLFLGWIDWSKLTEFCM